MRHIYGIMYIHMKYVWISDVFQNACRIGGRTELSMSESTAIIEKIMAVLETRMDIPKPFGWFHLLFWALTIAGTVILIWRFRNASDKTVRRILLGIWIVMVILEIYKQIEGAHDVVWGVPVWSYLWRWFPLQFCSTPLYCLPFIIFLPDCWWRRAFSAFFAGFSLFAGLAVMLYPIDVFTSLVGINIQTMIHHGSMVALGIFMVTYNRHHMNKRYFVGSLAVFYSFAGLAIVLNEVIHAMIVEKQLVDQNINLFFISRHYPCTLPVLADIYAKVPYPVFLCIYLVGFAAVSALIYGLEKGILALIYRKKRNTLLGDQNAQ